MNNQEAINILEQYREKPTLVNEIETVEEAVWLDEALEMAIKALEEYETVTEFADRCRECGKMRKGHWIDIDSKSFEFHRVYKCSECGSTEIEYPEGIHGHFKYCPSCGAKMEEQDADKC